MPRSSASISTNTKAERNWPIFVLLVLAVAIPTAIAGFLLARTMQTERQRLETELSRVYSSQVTAGSQEVSGALKRWRAEMAAIANAGASPAARFQRLLTSTSASAVIVFSREGEILYPSDDIAEWAAKPPAAATSDLVLDSWDAAREARAKNDTFSIRIALLRLRALSGFKSAREPEELGGRSIALAALLMSCDPAISNNEHMLAASMDALEAALVDYESVPAPSSQRRFVMNEFLAHHRNAKRVARALEAENFAARNREAWRAAASRTATAASSSSTSDLFYCSPPDGNPFWCFEDRENGAVLFFEPDRFRSLAMRESQTAPGNYLVPLNIATSVSGQTSPGAAELRKSWGVLPDGQRIELDGGGYQLLALSMLGDVAPGWAVAVVAPAGHSHSDTSRRRLLVVAWAAGLSLAATALCAALALRSLRRRLVLARLRNDIAATVAHELKTPIASIRIMTENLLDDPDADAERMREDLRWIARENTRLGHVVESFLLYSRLERGRLELSRGEVDVRDALDAALDATSRPRTEGGGGAPQISSPIQFDPSTPAAGCLRVEGDRDALVTIVVNLLDNALKYGASGGPILVSAGERPNDGGAWIAVKDRGMGISRADRARIFEPFYQVDRRLSRAASGVGLGLTISQALAQAMGGRIEVESEPGAGALFRVILPGPRATATQGAAKP